MRLITAWAAIALLLSGLLSACGGGGNVAPVADAGVDLNAEAGAALQLSGAGSRDADGDLLTYSWVLTSSPEGSAAALVRSDSVNPGFTPELEGRYVFSLVVRDGQTSSAPDTVTVVVRLSAQAQSDRSLARAAMLKAVYSTSASFFTLDWLDTFPAGARYRIDAEFPDGQVRELETVEGFAAPTVRLTSGQLRGYKAFRVLALLPGREVPLRTVADTSTIPDRISGEVVPKIHPDQTVAISGAARLSLDATKVYGSVAWALDGVPIGNGGDGVGHPMAWDFGQESSGFHAVSARIAWALDTVLEVGGVVRVQNALPEVSLTDGYLYAYPEYASVSLSLNGRILATLTRPNACTPGLRADLRCYFSPNGLDSYRFDLDAFNLKSGDHVLVYTVTDSAGRSVQRRSTVSIANPPANKLDLPPDGSLAFGSMRLRGNFASDMDGSLTVTATLTNLDPSRSPQPALNFQPIFSTSTSTSGSASDGTVDQVVDLSKLPPGSYSMSVIARNRGGFTETKRKLIVTSSLALRHDPVHVADGFGLSHFTAQGDWVAYRDQRDQVRLLNTTTGVGQDIAAIRSTLLVSGGSLYGAAWMPGCVAEFGVTCLYEWRAAAPMRKVADGLSASSNSFSQMLVRGSTLVWPAILADDRRGFTIYDTARQATSPVRLPQGVSRDYGPGMPDYANDGFDFYTRGGSVELLFAANLRDPLQGPSPDSDIFRWSSSTGQTNRISPPGAVNLQVKTDGVRAAWTQFSNLSDYRDFITFGRPLPALVGQVLERERTDRVSGAVSDFYLRDGVLAWVEATPTGRAIKASTATAIHALATDTVAESLNNFDEAMRLAGTSAGTVLYRKDGKFWVWHAGTQQARVVLDTTAVERFELSGEHVFFTIGRCLYRVALNVPQ